MKKEITAHIFLLLVSFIWGVTFTLVKDAISYVDVFVFLLQRFLIAFLFFIPFVLFYKKSFHIATLVHGIFLGTLLFLAYAFQTIGLKFTTASNAGFVTGLNVVLVPIINSMFFKKHIPVNAKVGSVLATIGLFFLCVNSNFYINKGDIIVFFCAICVALHIIFTGRYTKFHNAFNLAFVQMGTICLLSGLVACIYKKGPELFIVEKHTVWALIICSVFASNFAFWAQTYFQRFTIPTKVAIIFTGEPVFGAMYANIFGGEILSTRGILGGFLIVLSMVLSEVDFKKIFQKGHMVP